MFNIVARRTLLAYCRLYPTAANALLEWYSEMLIREFSSFQHLKQTFTNASLVGDNRVVFNIMGNTYRLVVRMSFKYKMIQIKWFGTHAEYDRIDVKSIKFNANLK